MVVGNHLFSFFDKKFREGVTRYESHPPSLRTVYFPTAPSINSLIFNFQSMSKTHIGSRIMPLAQSAHRYFLFVCKQHLPDQSQRCRIQRNYAQEVPSVHMHPPDTSV